MVFLVGMVLIYGPRRTGVIEWGFGWHCGNEIMGGRAAGFEKKRI
jgi:hypothetical protein